MRISALSPGADVAQLRLLKVGLNPRRIADEVYDLKARGDELAGVHVTFADGAVAGRADLRVGDVDLGGGDGCLARIDLCTQTSVAGIQSSTLRKRGSEGDVGLRVGGVGLACLECAGGAGCVGRGGFNLLPGSGPGIEECALALELLVGMQILSFGGGDACLCGCACGLRLGDGGACAGS